MSSALKQYREEFGAYPEGGNKDIADALFGKNPKQVIFLEDSSFHPEFTSPKGELIDHWGTPYRLRLQTMQ